MSAYSDNSYTVYRSVALKNNTLGTVDIIFINTLQFLSFFSFYHLQNLVKCMDSMVPCYSLLNMKVTWLYMVSPLPSITIGRGGRWRGDDWTWKFFKILWWQKFFLHLLQDKLLWVELKKWGSNIYYYITTLSLFHFFRNSQLPEKWSVSFKNFCRRCEWTSCYLLISSNLQFQF